MGMAGVEPARDYSQRILSSVRLPITSHAHKKPIQVYKLENENDNIH